jgi:predicted O-methyltransferase YrrM
MPTPSADAILALARNFWECRVLLTAAELDLFTLLAPAPLTAQAVADRVHGDRRAVTILLDALAALELLQKRDGQYCCVPEVAECLVRHAPQSVLPMVLHSANLWHRWSELTGVVRGDQHARARAQAPQDDAGLAAFIGAMHVVSGPRAPAIVAAVDPGPARALLDVGGGPGTYTIAFLKAVPHMRATLFDRPAVIELARRQLAQAGVLERVRLVGGDFDHDALPAGHDLALVSAIIHQNSPAQNVDLFQKVCRALLPGGRIVIRDHVMSPDRLDPRDGALFAVNMLVATAGGNTYTFAEIEAGLTAAGFTAVRLLQRGSGMIGLVEGVKSAA